MLSAPDDSPLQLLAEKIYHQLAQQFPVCCASDEFYFFPQVVTEGEARWKWDDLSADALTRFAAISKGWEVELRELMPALNAIDDKLDADLLLSMLQTLREQLQQVVPHCQQPTFYLSILVAGLAEALEAEDSTAWKQRIAGLPDFLLQAGRSLEQVPRLFLNLGLQMLSDLQKWFAELAQHGHELGAGQAALARFAENLTCCTVQDSFLLSPELFRRLLSRHLCCNSELEEIEQELRAEQAEMDAVLQQEAARLTPRLNWQQADSKLPFVAAELKQLYRPELQRQEDHCRQTGLVPDLAGKRKPELAAVPASMAAIRASDAYSARVGHPASGGIFYLFDHREERGGDVGRSLEYRMTAAHEAWPGHHLLDSCRWNLPRPIRRPLERPLFYEGWACFAEQLMAETGYFNGCWDRFLLARRRIERAARGLADLGLQSGRIDLNEATRLLVQVGYSPQKAAGAVQKYGLRPGYQVCYTLGLRRMLQLREEFAELDVGAFARQILTQGEIEFAALRRTLQNRGG